MGSPNLFQFKVMYIHGRRKFTWEPQFLKNMRENLATGGLLFGDACCGSREFDTAFRDFVKELYPDKKLERIPLDDELFGEKMNGRAITTVRCRTEKPDGTAEAEYQEVQPFLEGIKVNNRWVIIYSKYDLGCAGEAQILGMQGPRLRKRFTTGLGMRTLCAETIILVSVQFSVFSFQ